MGELIKIPDMPELAFSEEAHEYRLDGERIPSVTQVMKPLSRHEYGAVDDMVLLRAAMRGTAVHEAIENYLKYGVVDAGDDGLAGYVDGFLEWHGRISPELIGSEVRIYHKLQRYAGTADMLAMADGKLTLIDFKTTSRVVEKCVRVQLEAYAQALKSHGIEVERKMVLHLSMDGKWKAPEYPAKDAEALRVFNSLKCLYDYLAV